MTNRRTFLKTTSLAIASGMIATTGKSNMIGKSISKEEKLKLGIASYSFRNYSLDETIQMAQRLGIMHIALKSMHMPLELKPGEIKKEAKKVRDSGIQLYGAGVIYMKNEKEVDQAFKYAKNAGLQVIIGVPNHELLDLTEEYIIKYDIKVAIHNHGPGDDVYPSPESVIEKIKNRDSRLGLCIDIGHTQRIGLDPAKETAKYMDRIHDVHIKDVTASNADGKTIEIGRGVINIPAFLKILISGGYKGIVGFEYEKDPDDIMPGISESIGYVKGVLDTL